MQIKCPHCRFKYNETIKTGMTELVSICPRCGHSFPVGVTEEDVRKEQTPPPPPTAVQQQPVEPPIVPVAPPVPQEPQPPISPTPSPITPTPPALNVNTGGYSSVEREPLRHYNYSPAPKGGVMRSMPGIVLFIIAAAITMGAIFGLSYIFGRDETEPVDTIPTSLSSSEMSNSEMGNFSYTFEGNIKGSKKSLPINMKITKTGTEVEGSYYYVNQNPRTTLQLKGKVANDGTITMREYCDGEEDSGSFEGNIAADGSFKGTFRYLKNKYRFELKKVKTTDKNLN